MTKRNTQSHDLIMEWPFITWMSTLFFLALFPIHGTFGCLDEERSALLRIKTSINHPDGAHLSSWNEGTHCCRWKQVKCNSTTGRVIELHLDFTRSVDMGEWYLNASLLLPFQELRSLNLSRNQLAGLIEGKAFERWTNSSKLEILDFSWNRLNSSDMILPYIGAQSSIKALDLSDNEIEFSSTGFKRLSKLRKLEMLDLSSNSLNISVVPYLAAVKTLTSLRIGGNSKFGFGDPVLLIDELATLSKLEVLDLSSTCLAFELCSLRIPTSIGALTSLRELYLSGNYFNSTKSIQGLVTLTKLEVLDLSWTSWVLELGSLRIPTSIGALTSLKELYLSGNHFNSTKSIQGLCKLKNLEVLDLSNNEFDGEIPPRLANLTNLRRLDLSYNQFNGPISILGSLTLLEYLSLSHNNFSGLFQLSSFANHSKLKQLHLMNKNNALEVDTESSFWVPTFQIQVFIIGNCIINKPNGDIPKFLYSQYDLRVVQLPYNNLKGAFPNWLLANNTHLEILDVRNNFLMGSLHLPHHITNTDMFWLDISQNKIAGVLSNKVSVVLPNLQYLNMSRNALSGSIAPSFGDLRTLVDLDLSYNNLEGEIPKQLVAGCVSLLSLKLSYNRLHGKLFPTNSNLSNLYLLHLDNNLFTGTISPGLFNSSWLSMLDISDNHISGGLPSQIGELTYLSTLILRGNYFEGFIPIDFCKLQGLVFLDLSENKLRGRIPSCLNQSSIRYLHLKQNGFTGNLSSALSIISSQLVTLDIRFNKIVGVIPSAIGMLSDLRALLLKGNQLHGPIPIELCRLNKLSILDLSCNNISGSIPPCFNDTAFGGELVFDDAFETYTYTDFALLDSFLFDVNKNIMFLDHVEFADHVANEQPEVEFITKGRSSSYKGNILYYMSGIDLSSNQLTGEIPLEIGKLRGLRALNFSNNQLTGSIPRTFSKLRQIESLDLSHNKLSGTIPSELTELYWLEVFTVAYNNLSGRIPDASQFSTFEEESYKGNPLLCGIPLKRSCFTPRIIQNHEEEDGHSDHGTHVIFYASFTGSYFVFFVGTIVVFYYSQPCAMPLNCRMWRFSFK